MRTDTRRTDTAPSDALPTSAAPIVARGRLILFAMRASIIRITEALATPAAPYPPGTHVLGARAVAATPALAVLLRRRAHLIVLTEAERRRRVNGRECHRPTRRVTGNLAPFSLDRPGEEAEGVLVEGIGSTRYVRARAGSDRLNSAAAAAAAAAAACVSLPPALEAVIVYVLGEGAMVEALPYASARERPQHGAEAADARIPASAARRQCICLAACAAPAVGAGAASELWAVMAVHARARTSSSHVEHRRRRHEACHHAPQLRDPDCGEEWRADSTSLKRD